MSNNFFNNNKSENFFSNSAENFLFVSENDEKKEQDKKQEKIPLANQYDDLRSNYEQIFIEAAESIRKEVNAFKPKNACETCPKYKECKIEKKDMFAPYPLNCKYKEWQIQILAFLAGDYKQKLKITYKNLMEKKCEYSCSKCADCCKLATSEYSYTQLKQRALRGDKFSADFVSVFIPYETEDEAKNANPEYFELLNNLIPDEKIYYYHCPKLDGNLCSDYENRPNICKNFPHNPLKLLPSACSFNAWRKEISHQAMLLKAKTDIIAFYKQKLG